MTDKILDHISHRRFNPLRGSWILVSPHRTKRPWQGQEESPRLNKLPDHDPKCYLCPGNARAGGGSNPDYANTFVFVNDYSAVKETQQPHAPSSDAPSSLLRAEPVTGKCYVMTFSSKHHLTLADMAPAAILPIVTTWTDLYRNHLATASPLRSPSCPPPPPPASADVELPPPSEQQLRYMQIFENKGPAMGCSNPHPHCQVWTTSTMPEEPATELKNMIKYRAEHGGRHLLQDYAKTELEKPDERVVWQNPSFVVVCPWWAVWPFEVLILPKRHVRALVDLTDSERAGFAEVIAEVTRRYDNLFECSFPYSSGIHQAPLDGTAEEAESSYLHMHFYPPLLRSASVRKFLVGYELMAEPQRDITPEQAAIRLRDDCGGQLYRERLE